MKLIAQAVVAHGVEERATLKEIPDLSSLFSYRYLTMLFSYRYLTMQSVNSPMTPRDHMSILGSQSATIMISGARYTPGITSPECFSSVSGSPRWAAPKSVMTIASYSLKLEVVLDHAESLVTRMMRRVDGRDVFGDSHLPQGVFRASVACGADLDDRQLIFSTAAIVSV